MGIWPWYTTKYITKIPFLVSKYTTLLNCYYLTNNNYIMTHMSSSNTSTHCFYSHTHTHTHVAYLTDLPPPSLLLPFSFMYASLILFFHLLRAFHFCRVIHFLRAIKGFLSLIILVKNFHSVLQCMSCTTFIPLVLVPGEDKGRFGAIVAQSWTLLCEIATKRQV